MSTQQTDAESQKEQPTKSPWRHLQIKLDAWLSDPANLLTIVLLMMFVAVWSYRATFGPDIASNHERWGQFGDFFGGVFNPIIGFLTLVALLVTVQQNKSLVRATLDQAGIARAERRFDASKDALASATTGIDAAITHLRSARNDRVRWISAARLLATAQRLRGSITEPTHLDMLEIVVEQARREVGDLLGYDERSKTGAFFYGSPLDGHDRAALGLDEAAKASTKGPRDLSIPEEAIWEFWSFAQFPANYADALSDSKATWDIDHTASAALWPGVFEYLRHRREWISAKGNLVKRAPPE